MAISYLRFAPANSFRVFELSFTTYSWSERAVCDYRSETLATAVADVKNLLAFVFDTGGTLPPASYWVFDSQGGVCRSVADVRRKRVGLRGQIRIFFSSVWKLIRDRISFDAKATHVEQK